MCSSLHPHLREKPEKLLDDFATGSVKEADFKILHTVAEPVLQNLTLFSMIKSYDCSEDLVYLYLHSRSDFLLISWIVDLQH